MDLLTSVLKLSQRLDNLGLTSGSDLLDKFAELIISNSDNHLDEEDEASAKEGLYSFFKEEGYSHEDATEMSNHAVGEMKEDIKSIL